MSSPKPAAPSKPIDEIEEDPSIFLRDQSPYEEPALLKKEEKDEETEKVDDENPPEVAKAVKAAAEAIQQSDNRESNTPPSETIKETEETNTTRLWPIDKVVSKDEFASEPASIRESLATAAFFANGLTYIQQIAPKTFPDKESALAHVTSFADNEGFTVSRKQNDEVFDFFCAHDTVAQTQSLKRRLDEDEEGAPHPQSPYDKCPFHVTVYKDSKSYCWQLKVQNADHNHGPSGPAASAKRRRLTYYQKVLQVDFALPRITEGSVSNDKYLTQEKDTGSLKGLVGALRFDNALLEEQIDEQGNVTHLFWTTQDCMDMLQQYPGVLFINFTKSPSMPTLVHIVGKTAFNTTFEVGYAFIKNTFVSDFRWVLYSLRDIASTHLEKEYMPSAVITHREPALMTAVDHIFENTGQICVSELTRDVYRSALSAFDNEEERKTFMKRFQELVDSETPDIYSYNHSDFEKKYSKFLILEFVSNNWLVYKTKFVRAWVDQHMHFNNYSMGKAEIAQATLKEYADESGGDLLKFLSKVTGFLAHQKQAHEELVDLETHRCPMKYFVPFYDDVRFKVSTHALEMIKEQHEMYLEAMSLNEPLHRCTRVFTTTTGLPCKHTLSRPVTMDDLHPHWWLAKQKLVKEAMTEIERLSNDLTHKFDRTMGIVKEHFLNYSSLESREFMLMNMIKYFSKVGVSSLDYKSLYGNTSPSHAGTRGSSPGASAGTSPHNDNSITLPRQLSTSVGEVLLSSPSNIVPVKPSAPLETKVSKPLFLEESATYAVNGQNGHADKTNTTTTESLTQYSALHATPTRRCGKCNQVGHNARTCGHRLSLQGV